MEKDYRTDHLALKVRNIDTSRAFYEKAFGFRQVFFRDFGNGIYSSYIQLPAENRMKIQLLQFPEYEPCMQEFGHLGLKTEHAETSREYHISCGFQVGELTDLGYQKGYFLKDPDGYEIEVVQVV